MQYITTRCPRCNKVIDYHKRKANHNYHSPVRRCKSCKGDFIDTSAIEIAFQSPTERFFRNIWELVATFIVLSMPILIISNLLFDIDETKGLMALWGVETALLVFLVKMIFFNRSRFRHERFLSLNRTLDSKYYSLLVKSDIRPGGNCDYNYYKKTGKVRF